MSKYGVNVPEGQPAFSIDDVRNATDKLADEKGEVGLQGKEPAACEHSPHDWLKWSKY